jgi:hypothetical protein
MKELQKRSSVKKVSNKKFMENGVFPRLVLFIIVFGLKPRFGELFETFSNYL